MTFGISSACSGSANRGDGMCTNATKITRWQWIVILIHLLLLAFTLPFEIIFFENASISANASLPGPALIVAWALFYQCLLAAILPLSSKHRPEHVSALFIFGVICMAAAYSFQWATYANIVTGAQWWIVGAALAAICFALATTPVEKIFTVLCLVWLMVVIIVTTQASGNNQIPTAVQYMSVSTNSIEPIISTVSRSNRLVGRDVVTITSSIGKDHAFSLGNFDQLVTNTMHSSFVSDGKSTMQNGIITTNTLFTNTITASDITVTNDLTANATITDTITSNAITTNTIQIENPENMYYTSELVPEGLNVVVNNNTTAAIHLNITDGGIPRLNLTLDYDLDQYLSMDAKEFVFNPNARNKIIMQLSPADNLIAGRTALRNIHSVNGVLQAQTSLEANGIQINKYDVNGTRIGWSDLVSDGLEVKNALGQTNIIATAIGTPKILLGPLGGHHGNTLRFAKQAEYSIHCTEPITQSLPCIGSISFPGVLGAYTSTTANIIGEVSFFDYNLVAVASVNFNDVVDFAIYYMLPTGQAPAGNYLVLISTLVYGS